jgi:hypothetical protein
MLTVAIPVRTVLRCNQPPASRTDSRLIPANIVEVGIGVETVDKADQSPSLFNPLRRDLKFNLVSSNFSSFTEILANLE